jgi:hypothetical protein
VFVLLRGELQVMDLDQTTPLYTVGEGAVFGEEVVLRHLQVGTGGWTAALLCLQLLPC